MNSNKVLIKKFEQKIMQQLPMMTDKQLHLILKANSYFRLSPNIFNAIKSLIDVN
jgi:hypothetical protein